MPSRLSPYGCKRAGTKRGLACTARAAAQYEMCAPRARYCISGLSPKSLGEVLAEAQPQCTMVPAMMIPGTGALP
eukprot:4902034-Amphidinium_carterae.1